MNHSHMMGTSAPMGDSRSDSFEDVEPTVVYTLKTEYKSRRFLYRGVGGSIDNMLNPMLEAHVDDIVKIDLIVGDGFLHDLVIPAIDAATKRISQVGEHTALVFRVEKPGLYRYFCSVPGHKALGMEGMFQVTE